MDAKTMQIVTSPTPYDVPFSHSTYVTGRRMDDKAYK